MASILDGKGPAAAAAAAVVVTVAVTAITESVMVVVTAVVSAVGSRQWQRWRLPWPHAATVDIHSSGGLYET